MRVRAAALVLPLLLVAGCSGGGDSDESSGDVAPAAGAAQDAGGTSAGRADGEGSVVDLRVAPGDAVIRTAELAVRVDDITKAADEAGRLARAAGGRVEAEDRSGSDEGGSATVQLRVPPAEFDATIADLVGLGDERHRRLSTEDVGDQIVDIELESLQARLEALEARVDLSTISVTFDSSGAPVIGDALGFGDGLAAGWSALSTTGRVLAVTAGALLPFLPLLLVAGWFGMRARSRRTAPTG
ncbi:MAG: DUF4349 domain-containing protein [Frankiales bacterium]|nr:MAG: DUF4349 domain-containing protein [Frankiales bacterium]